MQPYPTSGAPVEQQHGPAPSSVLNAVKLMYAGAAITTVAIIVSLLTIDSTRNAVRKANHNTTLTAHQITQLANFVIVAGIVSSVIAIGLWLWMAWKTGQGRGWARIVLLWQSPSSAYFRRPQQLLRLGEGVQGLVSAGDEGGYRLALPVEVLADGLVLQVARIDSLQHHR
jgi:hypothetical protein